MQADSSDRPVALPDEGEEANSWQTETALIHHVAKLDEQAVLALVRERLSGGDDPLSIVEECQEGMRRVGEQYEQGRYYLAGLIMAGEIINPSR